MNLIDDPWIPAVRDNGERERIAPWQLAEQDNPIVELAAPRPDFQGGLYQFLIGLLQTTFVPKDQESWQEAYQTPPSVEVLKKALVPFVDAFDLSNPDGPAFLQDYDLPEGEQKPLSALLIEAPGGKTLKDNLDHFVKGGQAAGACESCAASALFTLQTNAPSGGVGHRVGLRGGGPLTTLVMPQQARSSLWQKLWLNVLSLEDLDVQPEGLDPRVFPWLAATRQSDKKGATTEPEDVSELQAYWGMPRRIRLQTEGREAGLCSLCGSESSDLITHFRTKNYGTNYEGNWVHPLTPYRFDEKKQKPPLSLKGQQGGLGYRHWLGLNWQDDRNGDQAARVTRLFNQQRINDLEELGETWSGARLWCFGFDMDNMKARCWYESQMPLLAVSHAYRPVFVDLVGELVEAAKDTVFLLRGQVKAAWFKRPKDVKGDTSMIDQAFWLATETSFYKQLQHLLEQPNGTTKMPAEVAGSWYKTLRQQALAAFDRWALAGDAEDLDMKRITQARRILSAKLINTKSLKALNRSAQTDKEVTP